MTRATKTTEHIRVTVRNRAAYLFPEPVSAYTRSANPSVTSISPKKNTARIMCDCSNK